MSDRPALRPLALPLALLLVSTMVVACLPTAEGEVAAAQGTAAAQASSPPVLPSASSTIRPTPSPTATVAPTPSPTASSTPMPTPTATPSPTPELAPRGPYEVNLYRRGDFVSQVTPKQCVAAAMQIMLNIGHKNDRSDGRQAQLARLAKRLSDHHDHGTEPQGWARGLEREGAGHYEVAVEPTMGRAVRRAIEAIRATGRPVGLLVWRGAHSWVLHGFETSRDPAATDAYKVRGLWVSDPWYPRVSSIWGPSRKPNQKITVKQLREDYLKWRRPTGRYPGQDGQYVLILPVDEAA